MKHPRLAIAVAFAVAALPALASGQLQTSQVQAEDLTQGLTPLPEKKAPAGRSGEAVPPTPAPAEGQAIDLVLLLDTSNSMDGLIEQAKAQLWGIVGRAAAGRQQGEVTLRVSLWEYGNDGLSPGEGYVRQVVPLTNNLDAISESLFALTTNGGSEFCGTVIQDAAEALDWAQTDQSYRAIFIAGNEPFTQGSVDYREACGFAKGKGIVVNTIHCGDADTGREGQWVDGARVGGGESFNINQDRNAVPAIECPQDGQLSALGKELNETYLWYGVEPVRRRYAQQQVAQDANAEALGDAVAVERQTAKAGAAYGNAGRDLIDTYSENMGELAEVPAEHLPESMRDLTPEQREQKVAETAQRRRAIQEQIAQLSAARAEFLAAEQKKRAEAGETTLGDAVNQALDRQLDAAGLNSPTTQPS